MIHGRCPLLNTMLMYDLEFSQFCRPYLTSIYRMRLHTHHVWPGQRKNVPSNLVDINPLVHDWLHHRTIEGRVAGIWARRQQPQFDWDELEDAAGRSVRGWLQLDKCHGLSQPYKRMHDDLLQEVTQC